MTGLTALLLYVVLMLVLPAIYVSHRLPLMFAGKKEASHWTRGNPDDDPALFIRLKHAHANMIENVGPFAAVVLAAVASGQAAVANAMAAYVLYARVVQIVAHSIGTSMPLVLIRATAWVVQVVLVLYMAIMLIG